MALTQEVLNNFLAKTNMKVLNKSDIIALNTTTYLPNQIINSYILIDNVIISNNICWCFYQEKSLISTSDKLNEFIKSIYNFSCNKAMYYIGIYITKKKVTSTMLNLVTNINLNNAYGIIYIINESNNDIILNKIQELFHSNNMFMYDKISDTIMGSYL